MTDISSSIKHIPFGSVVVMLDHFGIKKVADFGKLKVHDLTPVEDQLIDHVKHFNINAPVDIVWDAYKKIQPEKAWNSNLIQFAFMHKRGEKEIYLSKHPEIPELAKNQLHILVIKLMFGVVEICVGHEVIEVNEEKKSFTTQYLQNSKSLGFQTIKLEAVSANETRVIHATKYYSGNRLRDRIVYPFFHSRTIGVLHNNVKAYVNAIRKSGQ